MSSSSQDVISLRHDEASSKKLLVFFITGNPGLIGYYQTFLTLCYDSLRSRYKDQSIHVTGTSLAGFELPSDQQGPWNLEDQIQHIDKILTQNISPDDSGEPTRVILIGHSVGAYILLEVLRRQKARCASGYGLKDDIKLIGGICLFPTVTHIAKSQSGKRFSIFFAIPFFAFFAGLVVNVLFSWMPSNIVQRLVGLVTGMPEESAKVTTGFLKSRNGVRQALYLAGHEMKTITSDEWDDELWGVVQSEKKTKLFFLFGTNDHWVADETRDELIAARAASGKAGQENWPVMEIDESGVPHGFCIKHNEPVAKKVLEYVDEAIRNYW